MLSVSLLTYLPPAKITPPSFDLNNSINADDLHVSINISPGTVGQNTFTVKLTSNGQPVDNVKETLLRFTPGQQNVSPSEAQLLGQGGGIYSTKGSYLSLPGNWQVQVVVRRENKFDTFANFNFSVTPPGANRESALTPNFAGGMILLDGLLFALAMLPLGGNRALPVWDDRPVDDDHGWAAAYYYADPPCCRLKRPGQPHRAKPSIHCGRAGPYLKLIASYVTANREREMGRSA